MTSSESSPSSDATIEAARHLLLPTLGLKDLVDALGPQDGISGDVLEVEKSLDPGYLRHQYDAAIPVIDRIRKQAALERGVGANTNARLLEDLIGWRRADTEARIINLNQILEARAGWFVVDYMTENNEDTYRGVLAGMELEWSEDRTEPADYWYVTDTGERFHRVVGSAVIIDHLSAAQQHRIAAHLQVMMSFYGEYEPFLSPHPEDPGSAVGP